MDEITRVVKGPSAHDIVNMPCYQRVAQDGSPNGLVWIQKDYIFLAEQHVEGLLITTASGQRFLLLGEDDLHDFYWGKGKSAKP